ncbi:MAG: hypothetical protein E7554_08935 [Ruminococcaceae bacterium]|nr:hypothetical protein [Oscillospiraceae bacterium]
MKKEYLFHGSPVRVNTLIPGHACDVQFEEGCQYAVYATTSRIMAILFSLGCIEDGSDAERIMMPEYGDKMLFKNCHPNYNGKGYIYHLDKSRFVHAMGSQWVCYDEIEPDFIEEIDVNDYLGYCIIEERNQTVT